MAQTGWMVRHHMGSDLVVIGDRAFPEEFEMVLARDDRRPEVLITFEVRDGVPQCRRVEVRRTEASREVKSSDLRGVSLEDALETAVARAAYATIDLDGRISISRGPTDATEDRATVQIVREVRRDSRRRMNDDMLRDVARVYREHVGDRPTAAVADVFDRSHRTAALYVQQARQRGFLGPTSQGKAGEQT